MNLTRNDAGDTELFSSVPRPPWLSLEHLIQTPGVPQAPAPKCPPQLSHDLSSSRQRTGRLVS